jgi:hypothetical protein
MNIQNKVHFQGLTLFVLTGALLATAQAAIFRLPRVRQKLNILLLPRNPTRPPTVLDTVKFGYKKMLGKAQGGGAGRKSGSKSKRPARHKTEARV